MAKILNIGEVPNHLTNRTAPVLVRTRLCMIALHSGVANPNSSGSTNLTPLQNAAEARTPTGQMWPRGTRHGGGA